MQDQGNTTITLVNASGAIFNLFKDKTISGKAINRTFNSTSCNGRESEILKVQAGDQATSCTSCSFNIKIQPREVTT